jgi:hypothetical protein
VILVLAEVTDSHHYSCSIINEIAENSTGTILIFVTSILATGHRLSMEIDLQSVFRLLCTAVLIG